MASQSPDTVVEKSEARMGVRTNQISLLYAQEATQKIKLQYFDVLRTQILGKSNYVLSPNGQPLTS